MIKKLSILIFSILLITKVFGQQDPMYSQYIFNGMIINPAYCGTREQLNATLLYRNQWIRIIGAPKTAIFSIDSPIRNKKIGLGTKIISDKIGVFSHYEISGIYSYKIYFKESVLSFGLEAGLGFYNSELTDVKYSINGQIDPAFQQNYHEIFPNFSLGTLYHTEVFYTGISVTNILSNTIQNKINKNVTTDMKIYTVNHFFLNSGYLIDISPKIDIQPSFLLKYVGGAPLEGDLNLIIMTKNISFGTSYRSNASINFITEVKISEKLKIGYCYEYSTNELSNFTSGSHEIVFRYQTSNTNRKFVSPRYY